MATFSKRATPSQDLVFRMVAGAVRTVMRVHPKWISDQRAIGSVAKRAAGTLTAQWPEVLAAKAVRSDGMEHFVLHAADIGGSLAEFTDEAGGRLRNNRPQDDGAHRASRARHRLRELQKEIGRMAGQARRDGDTERHAALVDVLRLFATKEIG